MTAYKKMDGKKIDGRRIVVDVERGRYSIYYSVWIVYCVYVYFMYCVCNYNVCQC